MKKYDIAIIGTDKRMIHMIRILTERGYRIICRPSDEGKGYNLAVSMEEAVKSADLIVGGIPFQEDDAAQLMGCLRKGQKIFAGMVPSYFSEFCNQNDILCYDFMKDEEMIVFNTIATAEGAILEALQNKETNIHRSKTLVLGYGRCAKVLCDKLKGLSADVTVCCRSREQMEIAKAFGFQAIALEDLPQTVESYEYIYNTIPAIVLQHDLLQKVQQDVLIIDIASAPGGVDYEAAGKLGTHALFCPGLPGKYAAEISAYKLADHIIRIAF